MNWFKNFKIGNKLFISFGSILLLNLLVVIFAFCGIKHLEKTYEHILENNVITIHELQKTKINILMLRRYEKDSFLNIGNFPKIKSYKEKWDNVTKDIEVSQKFINEKLELMKITDALESSKKLQENLNIYIKGFNEVYSNLNNESITTPQEGNKAISKYKDAIHNTENLLENNIKKLDEKLIAVEKENLRISKFIEFIIIVLAIISITVSVILSIVVAKVITEPINTVVANLNHVAHGNLNVKTITNNTKDETGILANSLNITVENLKKLIREVALSSEELSAGSEELYASANQTSEGSQQVATSVNQLAIGSQEQANNVCTSLENINEINNAVQKIAENAQATVELSQTTENNADEGKLQADNAIDKINQIKETATEVSETINKLGKLSGEIEQIVDLIKGIANQTNLLALNAAIEAARAGEHGKGFAVVADEVKKLAGQSAGATEKITGMIKEIQSKTKTAVIAMDEAVSQVGEGVLIVENTGKSLLEILQAAKKTSDQIEEISAEAQNLSASSESVVRMMENISSITEEATATAEEIASITEEQTASVEQISESSQSLAKIAENLNRQISTFKI